MSRLRPSIVLGLAACCLSACAGSDNQAADAGDVVVTAQRKDEAQAAPPAAPMAEQDAFAAADQSIVVTGTAVQGAPSAQAYESRRMMQAAPRMGPAMPDRIWQPPA